MEGLLLTGRSPTPQLCREESSKYKNMFWWSWEKAPGGSGLGRVPVSCQAAGVKALCSLSKQTTQHRGSAALGQ